MNRTNPCAFNSFKLGAAIDVVIDVAYGLRKGERKNRQNGDVITTSSVSGGWLDERRLILEPLT